MATNLALQIIIGASDQASAVVGNIARNMNSSLSTTNPVAGAVVTGLTAIVGGTIAVGAKSTQMAADFEQAMLLNVSHAGLLRSKMDETGRAILDMSTIVGRSPIEMAQALYPILSGFSGIRDQSAKTAISLATLKMSFQAVAGSEASGVDVAHSAISAFNAFGMQTNNQATNLQRMKTLFDQMNETVKQGNMKWADYSRTVGGFAAKMSQAHVSFAEGNSALAIFTNTGETAQLAATHLGALFLKMANDTNTLAKHAEKLHLSFDTTAFKSMNLAQKIAYLDQITGHDPGKIRAILGNQTMTTTYEKLLQHMGDYKTSLDAISHSHGSLQSSFQTASSGFNAGMQRMKSSVDVLMITIGQALLPVFSKLVAQVTPLITQFTAWLVKSGALQNAAHFLAGAITNVANVVSNVVGFFQHNQVAMTALIIVVIALAGAIGGILVFALFSAAAAAWAAIVPMLPFIAIGAAVALVIAGIVYAVMHWGEIAHWLQGVWAAVVAWLSGVWGAFSGWFMGILASIGAFFVGLWNHIVSATQAAWNWIVNAVKIGAMILLAVIFAPIIAIAALFVWLYNHNYYFKAMIDAIVNFVKAGVAWLVHAWQSVTGWISHEWQYLTTLAHVYWTLLVAIIQMKILQAELWLKGIWNDVVSFLKGIWNDITTGVGLMWGKISSIFSSAWSTYVSTPLHNLWQSIVSFANGWPAQMLQFGINMIQGFISGMLSMLGNVGNAASQIMSNVAKFLGFHSPAKEGEGQHLLEWPRNMVHSYADEMAAQTPYLQSKVSTLIAPLVMMNHAVPLTRSTAPLATQGGGGGTVINVTVNAPARTEDEATEIAQAVSDKLSRMLRGQGTLAGGLFS